MKTLKFFLAIFVMFVFNSFSVAGKCQCDSPCLLADLDQDCYVNFNDFARLALYWLETCDIPGACGWADMYTPGGDGIVDLKDLREFVSQWLMCTDSANPDCEPLPPYIEEADLYEPPHPVASPANPTYGINLATGEFRMTVMDLRVPGRGVDFIWPRTYRSRTGNSTNAMAEENDGEWNLRIPDVEPAGPDSILTDSYGRRDLYKHQADGTWVADGFFRILSRNPDLSFTLTFPDKRTWTFNPFDGGPSEGKISQMSDRNGNSIEYDYDEDGLLTTITDTLGREITVGYNGDGQVESITDFAGRKVSYEYYDGNEPGGCIGDLESVTTPAITGTPTGNDFPNGKTTIYTFTSGFDDARLNHNLLTIIDPNGQTFLQNIYSPTTNPNDPDFDRVVRQIWGESGDVIDITYVQEVPSPANNYAVVKAVTNDRVGNVAAHYFDEDNRLVMVRRYTGRADPNLPTYLDPNTNPPVNPLRLDDPPYYETRYGYNADSLPARIDYPNGNYVVNVYGADLDPNASQRSRGNLRERHIYVGVLGPISDQNEIVEFFEYDTDMGGCCGFNFVTHYVDPNGDETLHDYDENGNRIETTYVRGAPDSNIVQEWEYNAYGQMTASILPDNGSGHRQRNEYAYYTNPADPNYGHLKETIIDVDNLALTTTYEYDQAGNVRRIIDPNGSDTQYIYNQLNQKVRKISAEVTDGSGVRYEKDTYYNEKDNVIRVDVQNINDEGELQDNTYYTTTYQYDILNNLIRKTEEIDPCDFVITEYGYDDNGNQTLSRFGEATNGNEPNNVVRTLYDERNKVFKITRGDGDPNQSTTQYDYDGNGNRTKVHEGLESTPCIMTSEYDGFNRLVKATDPMGNVTTNEYDARGNRILTRTDGELVDVAGGLGNVRLYEASSKYDDLGRLTKTEVAFFDPATQVDINDGKVTTEYQYNDNSQITKLTNDNGNETKTTYDTANRKSVVTDAKENTTTYTYDEKSNVIAVTRVEKSDLGDPNETFVTTYEYGNLNRLIKTIDNVGNTTEYACDSRGNRTKMVDAKESVTRYDFDGLGRLTKTIRDIGVTPVAPPVGPVSWYRLEHNANDTGIPGGRNGTEVGGPTYTIDCKEGNWAINLDGINDYVQTAFTAADYGIDGNKPRTITAWAKTRSFDEYAGLYEIGGFEEGGQDFSMLTNGDEPNVWRASHGGGPGTWDIDFGYPSLNTWVHLAHVYDGTTVRVYADGYLVAERALDLDTTNTKTFSIGQWSSYGSMFFDGLVDDVRIYDYALNRANAAYIAGSVVQENIITTQSWDDSSRLTSRADDNGNTTTYEYDPLNRLVKTIYADGTSKQVSYDVHNNPIQIIDAAGSVVGYTHDDLNRLTRKDITPGVGVSNDTTFEDYQYDGLSRMVCAEDDDSVVTFSYDSVSNVAEEMLNGETTDSSYDGLGNKLSCTYPGGRTIDYTYDALNRIKAISDVGGTIAAYDYIGPGRVERRDYGNNTRTTYDYDNLRRITQTTHTRDPGGTSTIIDDRTYTWDETYNKTQRKGIRAGGPQLTHDYSYDLINRLVHTTVTNNVPVVVRDTDYSLDGVNNRTSVTGSPDPGVYTMDNTMPEPADEQMNQYTTTPFDGRLYDKNGNLTTIDNGLPTQKGVTYDYRNRMVEITDTGTGQVHTYSYDTLGRRIQKVVDSTGTPLTTRYFYDGWQVIEEQDGAGATQATYVYGNYFDEVLNMQRGANNYYYHSDDLLNVMVVTDAGGNAVERYEYQDYGEPEFFNGAGVPIAGTAIGNPYLFTGRRYDAETGLYYYRTRYLDPVAGRFVIRDKIGIWGDAANLGNAYTYAGGNPWSQIDPSGLGRETGPYGRSMSNMEDAGIISLGPAGGCTYDWECGERGHCVNGSCEYAGLSLLPDTMASPLTCFCPDGTKSPSCCLFVMPADFEGASRSVAATMAPGGISGGSYSLWDISGGSYSVADTYAPGGGVYPAEFEGRAAMTAPDVFDDWQERDVAPYCSGWRKQRRQYRKQLRKAKRHQNY